MKVRTSNLLGPALDVAVLMALGVHKDTTKFGSGRKAKRFVLIDAKGERCKLDKAAAIFDFDTGGTAAPSTNWSQGGPIIDREGLEFRTATKGMWASYSWRPTMPGTELMFGETHLIAAMRCLVASKLGNEVDVPEEIK